MNYPKKIIVNIVLIPIIIFFISLVTPLRYLSSDHHIEGVMRSNLCENGEIVWQMKSFGESGNYNIHTILKYEDEYGYLVTDDDFNIQLSYPGTAIQNLVFENGLCMIPIFEFEENNEKYIYSVVISQNDAVEKVVVETVDTVGNNPSLFAELENAEADKVNIFVGISQNIYPSTTFIFDGFCYDRTARGYDKNGNLIAEHFCGYEKRMESYK